MNFSFANFRRAAGPAALSSAIVAVASVLIGWIARRKVDATAVPIEIVRETVWQSVGIAGVISAVAVLAVPVWAWWFNDPGRGNRQAKTVALTIIVFGLLAVAGWVFGSVQPFEADADRWIYLRGVLIGVIGMAAFTVVLVVIANEVERRCVLEARVSEMETEVEDYDYAVQHHRDLLDANGIDWRATF